MLSLPLPYNCSVICDLYLYCLFTFMYLTLDDLYFVLFKSISVDLNGPNIWVVTVGIRARFSLKTLVLELIHLRQEVDINPFTHKFQISLVRTLVFPLKF